MPLCLTSSLLSPHLAISPPHLLDNGFKLISVFDASNPVLCLQLYIKTGSVLEEPEETGYSHFIEHLCFKSTSDFPDNAISRYASGLGGMLNAYTDYDCTCYYLNIPAEHLEEGLYILSQLAMHPVFSASDIAMEREIILEEISQYENDPEPDFIEFIQTSYFTHSPLSRPVLGNVQSVKNANYTKLSAYYAKHYNPDNAFLVVCGDFSLPSLTLLGQKFFGSWKTFSPPVGYPTDCEPELGSFRLRFRKRSQGEEFLALAMPELSELHPASDALLVAMRYFAIGKSSRLFKRLVEEEKLCSAVKVSSLCGVISGASVILFCPINRKAIPQILDIVAREFCTLKRHGIPLDDFHLIKRDIIHSWLYSFEGMENLANLVAAEEFIGNLELLSTYGARIEALAMADVIAVMDKYWQPEYFSIYHQGAKEDLSFGSFTAANFAIPIPEGLPDYFSSIPLGEAENQSQSPTRKIDKANTCTQITDNHYQITLGNGMTVLFKQLKQKTISGFSLSTHISQLCESPGQRGINFFTSALLLYGSKLSSHEKIMRLSREQGFNIRVIHHLDSTNFRGKCQSFSLETALKTLSELLLQPLFPSSHLHMLITSALDGIRRDNDNPVSYAYQKWFQMLVGKNSNLFRGTGNPADIRAIRLKDINAWHQNWNIGRDFSLAIVGSHQIDEVTELCERLLGFTQAATPVFSPQPLYSVTPANMLKQYRKSDQAIIHLGGFATPAHLREQNAAFHVLSQVLGGDITSVFFDILREKHGFAYQTGFDFSSINNLGFWNAYAFCDRQEYRKCTILMQDILAELISQGIDENQLHTAKQYLIGMNRFDYESASYTASSMANLAALGYEAKFYLERESRIRAVTADQINQIASEWLNPANQYLHQLL